MIKQKRFNFKIASLIAMMFMGLVLVFANSPGVLADNLVNFRDGDGQDQRTQEVLSEFFLGKSGYLTEYTLSPNEIVTLDSSGKLKFENRTLDVSYISYIEIMNVTFKDGYGQDQGTASALSEFFLGKSGYLTEYTLTGNEIVTLDSSGKLKFENRTLDVSNIYWIEIINDSLRPEDSVPAISGEHTVIANVDNPYTIERIKEIANLTALDDYYGDLTDLIEVVKDDYTINNNKVGIYEIEFKVTNASNLSTTFILKVSVKDIVAPVINGPATSNISYTEKLNLEAFLTDFTVTDNHDETVLLNVDSNSYVGNEEKVGTYQIKLSATDSSGNKGTFTHTITVIDDVKPNFVDEHTGKIQINWKEKITDELLLLDLTANDKIDGDITNNIVIKDKDGIKNELGTYKVKYEVKDTSGNISTYTRTYEVITTDSPVFWVSKNLLLISDVNKLTTQQLAEELSKYENIKMASFTVIEDEYTGNEETAGEYTVRIAIADTDGKEHHVERTIRVFAEDEMPESEPTFIDKVINFFVNIWEFIVKVFTWILNAIKWLWNLLFGWIN